MNGTDALISLIRTLEKAEVPYMIVGSYSSNFYGIKDWCAKHETLDLLAEAKTEATPAWEDA
jgi:hypothetical protein